MRRKERYQTKRMLVKRMAKTYGGRKLNIKRVVLVALILLFILVGIPLFILQNKLIKTSSEENVIANAGETDSNSSNNNTSNSTETNNLTDNTSNTTQVDDWRIRLANYDNLLPEDFEVDLANIDETRQFDARAIDYLTDMLNDMRKDGIVNIWVQSAYRSVARQKELYDNKMNEYLEEGKTQEEAQKLTEEYINKPGSSDHNLGLAVDFNYVDNSFAKTDAYKWLLKNAENYGFILRYPKDKEDITKIEYESWHWRYVGEEHAKKMNELGMCLEEYVEYLKEYY